MIHPSIKHNKCFKNAWVFLTFEHKKAENSKDTSIHPENGWERVYIDKIGLIRERIK